MAISDASRASRKTSRQHLHPVSAPGRPGTKCVRLTPHGRAGFLRDSASRGGLTDIGTDEEQDATPSTSKGAPSPDGEQREPIDAPLEAAATRLVEPFQSFVGAQSASGWFLLLAALAAVVLANSPYAARYEDLQHLELGLTFAGRDWTMSLHHWVNDGLMALFFCLLGLELKRELLVGHLSNLREASGVVAAALGGIVVPALLFLLVTEASSVREAWAIPIATDTAFALALLVLLGHRVPAAARAFLVGLAIVDDLGAILVIALVYSHGLEVAFALPTLAVAATVILMNLTGVRNGWPYLFFGVVLWALFLQLGLHGTLAGVVVALLIPVRPALSRRAFVERLRVQLQRFRERHDPAARTILHAPEQHELAGDVLKTAKQATVPLRKWEERMELPISFFVLPVFAFLNAGVALDPAALLAALENELSHGILMGLLLGKPVGILAGVALGALSGVAEPPRGLSWGHVFGLGILGGIGFTMSLFIATLSFGEAPVLLAVAKQSVIAASLVMGLVGFSWLWWIASAPADE